MTEETVEPTEEREPLVQINTSSAAFVEVTVQLATGEAATFRREYAGDSDTSPLELLDALVDAVKSYLETL